MTLLMGDTTSDHLGSEPCVLVTCIGFSAGLVGGPTEAVVMSRHTIRPNQDRRQNLVEIVFSTVVDPARVRVQPRVNQFCRNACCRQNWFSPARFVQQNPQPGVPPIRPLRIPASTSSATDPRDSLAQDFRSQILSDGHLLFGPRLRPWPSPGRPSVAFVPGQWLPGPGPRPRPSVAPLSSRHGSHGSSPGYSVAGLVGLPPFTGDTPVLPRSDHRRVPVRARVLGYDFPHRVVLYVPPW